MRERASSQKVLRCAIYTRKSSEEGLEQEFNSLHAQREACEAYIASQKHEGWRAIGMAYDDGGFSGGSMERPALRKLLADVQVGAVDVIVVYKVDRLTRALSDFAKMVEVFDAKGVSFVSVTQQFNTTTSMGRLTLNVLLSFAQFEREVTGERIRDKIAASKKKGMWMGGWVPIGYDALGRSLTVNEAEAKTVRALFKLYVELKNVRLVQREATSLELTTKRYVAGTGRAIGGLRFSRGHIYKILSNPIYVGEIEHRGVRHPAQHSAIVGRDLFDAVQALLRTNRQGARSRSNAKVPSLLSGLLFDEDGNRLTPTHAVKNGKRYRYYFTAPKGDRVDGGLAPSTTQRIPASELETIVVEQLCALLESPRRLSEHAHVGQKNPAGLRAAFLRGKQLASDLRSRSGLELSSRITEILARVEVGANRLVMTLNRASLEERVFGLSRRIDRGQKSAAAISLTTSLRLERRGVESKLIVEGCGSDGLLPHASLIKAVARAHVWLEELASGRARTVREIAMKERVDERFVAKHLPWAFVSPPVVEAVLRGDQFGSLSANRLATPGDSLTRWKRIREESSE